MAVIITDMNLPNSCADCPICHCKGKDEPWNYCCFVTMDDINIEEWDEQRYITCPLKSVDGMIAEILQKAFATGDPSESHGLHEAVDIIHKYFG